jgi:hypothetical protein
MCDRENCACPPSSARETLQITKSSRSPIDAELKKPQGHIDLEAVVFLGGMLQTER